MRKNKSEMRPQYFDITLVIPFLCLIGFAKPNPNYLFILIATISGIFFFFMRIYIRNKIYYNTFFISCLIYSAISIIISWKISYDRIGVFLGNTIWLYLFAFLLLSSIIIVIKNLSNLLILKYINYPQKTKGRFPKLNNNSEDYTKLNFLKEDIRKIKEIKKIINQTQNLIDSQAEIITKNLNDLKFDEKYHEFENIMKQKREEINKLKKEKYELTEEHDVLEKMKLLDAKQVKSLKKILFGRSKPIELIIGFLIGLFVEFIARIFF